LQSCDKLESVPSCVSQKLRQNCRILLEPQFKDEIMLRGFLLLVSNICKNYADNKYYFPRSEKF